MGANSRCLNTRQKKQHTLVIYYILNSLIDILSLKNQSKSSQSQYKAPFTLPNHTETKQLWATVVAVENLVIQTQSLHSGLKTYALCHHIITNRKVQLKKIGYVILLSCQTPISSSAQLFLLLVVPLKSKQKIAKKVNTPKLLSFFSWKIL